MPRSCDWPAGESVARPAAACEGDDEDGSAAGAREAVAAAVADPAAAGSWLLVQAPASRTSAATVTRLLAFTTTFPQLDPGSCRRMAPGTSSRPGLAFIRSRSRTLSSPGVQLRRRREPVRPGGALPG